MSKTNPESSAPRNDFSQSRWTSRIVVGCVLVILFAFLSRRQRDKPHTGHTVTTNSAQVTVADTGSRKSSFERAHRLSSVAVPTPTAEEIVASKVSRFARERRALAHALARRFNIEVPADVERFFDAVEGGRWEEIDAAFKPIGDRYKSIPRPHDLDMLWGPILEAFGVAESAHDWPAQKLLDYGNAVLGSLRPGMVYVGGTDPGRFIPTLLNETSDGERHIVVTQNGLAASSYVDYLNFLYGERLATLTHEDSNRAFQDYLSDLQRRLAHDQQFPEEPKQVLPGENKSEGGTWAITSKDGQSEVAGNAAIMAVNERLLKMLLEKNPGLSFALEESFPLKSTYAEAAPLGPITELRAQEQSVLTAERAAQSVEYWRAIAEQFRTNPDESADAVGVKSYSKLAVAQANLFADRNFTVEAEQAYRIANQIYPGNVEATVGLAEVLTHSGRAAEANQMLDQFVRDHPNHRRAVENFRENAVRPVL